MTFRRFIRLRSFRLRIALLSVAVSGLTLAVFGSLTLAAMQRISLERIDKDIKEFAHKHLVEPRGGKNWERVADSLHFFLGDEEANAFIMLVKDREGATLYITDNWPREIPVEQFPATDAWGRYSELSQSLPRPPRGNDRGPGGPPAPLKVPEFSTYEAAGTKWRVGMMGNPDITIVLGLNMRRITEEMAQVRHGIFAALPIALLFVAVGAWWLSQRTLRPIKDVTETIKRIRAKGLDQRITAQDEDREFSELIAVFNDMMDWLEKSFHQAIRFSADASHELKTPLTVLQAQLEQAVHEAEPGSDEQRRYVAFGKELQRLKSITQKLLLLSRIDAGELKLNLRPLNVSQLLEGIVEDTEVLAPTLNIKSELAPDLWVMADADLIKQVLQNLATNAIKFNQHGGLIQFNLQANGDQVLFTIANTGQRIPSEDRDKVFTRFYRGDKARSRQVGGAGLGLSLAREIVRAHHGELTLECSSDETTAFRLAFPKATS